MADDKGTKDADSGDQDADDSTDDTDTDAEDEDDDSDDAGGTETVTELRARLAKAEKAATRRDRALRKAQADLKAATESKGEDKAKEAGPSAEDKANAKLVRASARTVLAGLGVARESMKDVLPLINLSGIDVDDDGDVDEEELADRIEALRAALAVKGDAKEDKPAARRPRVSSRDKGTDSGSTADPDAARYRAFLGR